MVLCGEVLNLPKVRCQRGDSRTPHGEGHLPPVLCSDAATDVPIGHWLNLVERFLGLLTEHALRRGSHTSVPELKSAIDEYIDAHNDEGKPFIWTKTADPILDTVKRFGERTIRVH